MLCMYVNIMLQWKQCNSCTDLPISYFTTTEPTFFCGVNYVLWIKGLMWCRAKGMTEQVTLVIIHCTLSEGIRY